MAERVFIVQERACSWQSVCSLCRKERVHSRACVHCAGKSVFMAESVFIVQERASLWQSV